MLLNTFHCTLQQFKRFRGKASNAPVPPMNRPLAAAPSAAGKQQHQELVRKRRQRPALASSSPQHIFDTVPSVALRYMVPDQTA